MKLLEITWNYLKFLDRFYYVAIFTLWSRIWAHTFTGRTQWSVALNCLNEIYMRINSRNRSLELAVVFCWTNLYTDFILIRCTTFFVRTNSNRTTQRTTLFQKVWTFTQYGPRFLLLLQQMFFSGEQLIWTTQELRVCSERRLLFGCCYLKRGTR